MFSRRTEISVVRLEPPSVFSYFSYLNSERDIMIKMGKRYYMFCLEIM